VRTESFFELFFCLLVSFNPTFLSAQQENEEFMDLWGEHFGQPPPGRMPEPFVPELFSVWGDYGFYLYTSVYFSPDNKALFFTNQTRPVVTGRSCSIWHTHQINGHWIKPEKTGFSSEYSDQGAFYSYDGEAAYFASTRPLNERGQAKDFDIWCVRKNEQDWSRPQRLHYPINTMHNDVWAVVAGEGILYFSSDRPGGKGGFDIYYTSSVNGDYQEPTNLGDSVNTDADECVSYVAPDETFMILRRTSMKDVSENGLYVSYQTAGGLWTKAKYMGDHINPHNAYGASVSPGGDYLFLLCQGDGICWLRADIIEYLRNENLNVSEELLRVLSQKGMDEALATYYKLQKRHADYIDVNEYLLNQRGHQFLDAERFAEAIGLFKIVVALFPDSWNAFDSLGEAYWKDRQTELAVQSYERSLELNPRNKNAADMLNMIRKYR